MSSAWERNTARPLLDVLSCRHAVSERDLTWPSDIILTRRPTRITHWNTERPGLSSSVFFYYTLSSSSGLPQMKDVLMASSHWRSGHQHLPFINGLQMCGSHFTFHSLLVTAYLWIHQIGFDLFPGTRQSDCARGFLASTTTHYESAWPCSSRDVPCPSRYPDRRRGCACAMTAVFMVTASRP